MSSRLNSSPLLYRILPQEDAEELYRIYPDLPKSHMSGCPSCGKNRGYGVDGVLVLDGEEFQCNCHDQLQRHKHYLNAGIGSIYQFLSWGDFKGWTRAGNAVKEWTSDASGNYDAGRGLYIYGSGNGTGKTMLGMLALKECVTMGYRCYATTFQNLLSSLKSGWKNADFDKWYRNKVDSAQILMIDDLGKEISPGGESAFNREFAQQTLDSLLRTRTQQGRPTFFTSNFEIGQLKSHYGAAAVSLMGEGIMQVEVKGSDYRPSAVVRPKGERRIY